MILDDLFQCNQNLNDIIALFFQYFVEKFKGEKISFNYFDWTFQR